MPTFSFDPSTGEGYEVGRGGQPIEDPGAPTYEELTERHIKQSARDFAARKQNQAQLTDSGNLEMEARLLQLRGQLASDDLNPIERLQIEALTEQIAAHLIGAETAPAQQEEADTGELQSVEDYQNELAGDPAVQAALEHAGEVFSEEVNISINEALSEADELQTQSGIGALQQLQANPDWVNTTDEVGAFTSYETDQITELVGAELGDKITTINAALASGAVDKGRAMRTVMADPELLTAMLQCSQAGIFKLAL